MHSNNYWQRCGADNSVGQTVSTSTTGSGSGSGFVKTGEFSQARACTGGSAGTLGKNSGWDVDHTPLALPLRTIGLACAAGIDRHTIRVQVLIHRNNILSS